MRLQILSDLHLESERFEAEPAPGAELLVLAGDIDSSWAGLAPFADWPVPVLYVPGNHEFDRRELSHALPGLRAHCDDLGITLLEREETFRTDDAGRRIRFLGTTRWCDFDLFGPEKRDKAMRAATYFQKVMQATNRGVDFTPPAVREEATACRDWLAGQLASTVEADATVVVTHFAPSALSADPRYGLQPGTAAFCNADDALVAQADLWIHGHLHCRQDYRIGRGRVVCNARGLVRKGEAAGYEPLKLFQV
jgi:predicted phosphodiesterase